MDELHSIIERLAAGPTRPGVRARDPGACRRLQLPRHWGAGAGPARRRHHRPDQRRLPGGRPAGTRRRGAGRRPRAHRALRFHRSRGPRCWAWTGLQRGGRRAAGTGAGRRRSAGRPLPGAAGAGPLRRPAQRPGDGLPVPHRGRGRRPPGAGRGTGQRRRADRARRSGAAATPLRPDAPTPARGADARSDRPAGGGPFTIGDLPGRGRPGAGAAGAGGAAAGP